MADPKTSPNHVSAEPQSPPAYTPAPMEGPTPQFRTSLLEEWVISGADLLEALQRVAAGEFAAMVYTELCGRLDHP